MELDATIRRGRECNIPLQSAIAKAWTSKFVRSADARLDLVTRRQIKCLIGTINEGSSVDMWTDISVRAPELVILMDEGRFVNAFEQCYGLVFGPKCIDEASRQYRKIC